MKSLAAILLGIISAMALIGCGQEKLETGYRYRSLDMNETQRKGMYAPAYSENAAAAAQNKDGDSHESRPGPP